jgi:putative dehydrogenase
MKIGVIGLGSMGMGAALNLVKHGHEVHGCELREAARAELDAAGGHTTGRAADLPRDLDALIVFVVNARQAEQVLFGPDGCAANMQPGAVVLCCTTLSPDFARALEQRLAAAGLLMLDAPVSGGAVGARGGSMTVMASGSPAAFDRAGPVLDAVASKVWRLGDAAGIGSTVKMVNQLLAGVHIATAAEALALGIRAGADPQTLFDVISTSAGSSWMWQNRVPHILAGDDTPLSAVDIFVKDLGIVLDQARQLVFPLPMASAAHQLFLAAAAAGHGGRDDAFVIRFWQALAGIALPGEAAADMPQTGTKPGQP